MVEKLQQKIGIPKKLGNEEEHQGWVDLRLLEKELGISPYWTRNLKKRICTVLAKSLFKEDKEDGSNHNSPRANEIYKLADKIFSDNTQFFGTRRDEFKVLMSPNLYQFILEKYCGGKIPESQMLIDEVKEFIDETFGRGNLPNLEVILKRACIIPEKYFILNPKMGKVIRKTLSPWQVNQIYDWCNIYIKNCHLSKYFR